MTKLEQVTLALVALSVASIRIDTAAPAGDALEALSLAIQWIGLIVVGFWLFFRAILTNK